MSITAEEVTLMWILVCSVGGIVLFIRNASKQAAKKIAGKNLTVKKPSFSCYNKTNVQNSEQNTMSESKKLQNYCLKPYYTFKKGDLVRVKDFETRMAGQIGLIISKEDYNTACMVLFPDGIKRKVMKFCLERVENHL